MSMNILTYFLKVNAVFKMFYNYSMKQLIEPNNVECATSTGSNQPVHTRSLIRAFAGRLIIL